MLYVIFFLHLIAVVVTKWNLNFGQLGKNRCLTPDLSQGLCVSLEHCQPMVEFLQQVLQPPAEEILTFLDQYRCSDGYDTQKICCPPNPVILDYRNLKTGTLPDTSRHNNLALLPRSCGRTLFSSRIPYGERTGVSEFPWVALLSYRTITGPEFQCAGSIINEKYILTAAHCLSNDLYSVRVGEHSMNPFQDCQRTVRGIICASPFQDLRIEKIIPHEKFDASMRENDIGLLRVERINFSGNTLPVCLPLAEAMAYNFTGKIGLVAGWGTTEQLTPELLKLYVPFVPPVICQTKYGSRIRLNHRQLCAGGVVEKDVCAGDSGGPLVVDATIQGRRKFVQQGIVSFGPSECGQLPIPGVYTKVAAYMDWILDHLEH